MLGAHDGIDEQLGLADPHGVRAEGAQAHGVQFAVAEDDGRGRAPFHVGEGLHVDEVDFGLEGGLPAEGQVDEGAQERDIVGLQGVAAGLEDIQRLAVAEEHGYLALPDSELGSPLDRAGARCRPAVHDLVAGEVSPFDHVE